VTKAKCIISQNDHPFFKCKLCSGSRAFGSQLRRNFSIVIEAIFAQRPRLHNHWPIFFQKRLLLVVQTYNNPMQLGLDTWGHLGEVQISAAGLLGCYYGSSRGMGRASSWNQTTFFCSKQCSPYCTNILL
jgi:hypothetical protein